MTALAADVERCVNTFTLKAPDCESCGLHPATVFAVFADNQAFDLCDGCAELVEVDS